MIRYEDITRSIQVRYLQVSIDEAILRTREHCAGDANDLGGGFGRCPA